MVIPLRSFRQIKDYILEQEFEINVFKDKVNIVNYQDIGHFDDNKVIIKYNEGEVTIKGKNLVVSRLMNEEILIKGVIECVELR